jgi:Phage terminase large subunit
MSQLLDRYIADCKAAGLTADQVKRLCEAGLFFPANHLRFLAAARECDQPDGPEEILCAGGRGSGKTNAVLAQMLVDDCQRFAGLRALSIRKTLKSSREQVMEVRKKLLSSVQHAVVETSGLIKFPNGSTCQVGGFKDDRDFEKFIGQEYDVIHIAECNQLTPEKIESLVSCLRTSKPGWRVRLYCDTNPGGISHEYHKRKFVAPCRAGKQSRTRYFHSTLADNPFIDPEYKNKMERLTGNKRKAWLDGDWDFRAGAYFGMWSERHHVWQNAGVPKPPSGDRKPVRWFAGYDYGIRHPASFHLLCEDSLGRYFVMDRWHRNDTPVHKQADAIKALLWKWQLKPEDLTHIAAGGDCFSRHPDGRTIEELFADHGIRLSQPRIERIANAAYIAGLLGDPERGCAARLFVSEICEELIYCLPLLAESETRPGDLEKMDANENGEGGDDSFEACRNGLCYAPPPGIVTALPSPLHLTGPMPAPAPLPRPGRLW